MSRVSISRRAATALLALADEVGFPSEQRHVDELRAALRSKRSVLAAKKVKRAKTASKREQTAAIRAEVMKRSGGACEFCGYAVSSLELHHGFGRVRVPQAVSNCLGLCHTCHQGLTESRGGAPASWERAAEVFARLGYEDSAKRAWGNAEFARTKAELGAALVAP